MIELKLINEFPREILAVDEVGRGPLGGPVVIGAVRILIEDQMAFKTFLKYIKARGIKDSKKLSSVERLRVMKKLGIHMLDYREKGESEIKGIKISYVTWEMCHETIDKENILAASLRGMKEAGEFLSEVQNTTILIDGHLKLRWGKEKSPWEEHPIVKGDSKSVLIGLASIIAKEKRDSFMRDMHELFPHYGFNTHYGYPTRSHRKAIKTFGPSPIHRKTFKGVKEFVGVVQGTQSLQELPR